MMLPMRFLSAEIEESNIAIKAASDAMFDPSASKRDKEYAKQIYSYRHSVPLIVPVELRGVFATRISYKCSICKSRHSLIIDTECCQICGECLDKMCELFADGTRPPNSDRPIEL